MLILEPAGPVRTFQLMDNAESDAGDFRQQADDGAKVLRDGDFHQASVLLREALGRWDQSPKLDPLPSPASPNEASLISPSAS